MKQPLHFICIWYNDFSENVMFDECIIIFDGLRDVSLIRVTRFWIILDNFGGSKEAKINQKKS